MICLHLAKNVFQAHGAGADGSVVFRRKLSQAQLLKFMGEQPPCIVAMEACAIAHHWGRANGDLGRGVRLIPPASVKPFVKRQKNDMADAEAIAEAASRPTMRFVAVTSEAQQAAAMAYRTRDLLVRQRTRTINALRAHLAEQGIVAPVGPAHVGRLAAVVDGEDDALPAAAPDLARLLLDQIAGLTEKVAGLDAELRKRVTTDDTARRLTTIPGLGPISAAAITTFASLMETFSKGRDFAA
jgi:transposase